MKIGILTFHCAHNYGAVLQAFALKEFLISKGEDAFIINYRPDYLLRPYKWFRFAYWFSFNPFRCIIKILVEFALLPQRYRRYKSFEKFINQKLRPVNIDLNSKETDINLFILGSDQIWNPDITGGKFDEIFFGRFPAAHKKKVITYAASSGGYNLLKCKTEFQTLVSGIDKISVREDSLLEVLRNLNIDAEKVVDPTLLAGKEIFEKIAIKPEINGPYVLVYEIHRHKDTYVIANQIAKEINAKVITLASYITYKERKNQQVVSPEEFVGYFKYADFIITSSFHGTIFSVMFNRNFFSMKFGNEVDNRTASFLKMIGLEDRMFRSYDASNGCKYDDIIQWLLVKSMNEDMLQKSRKYLDNFCSHIC